MNGAAPVEIVALVTHARHVPAVERERFAGSLRQEPGLQALVVETCHRVELYLGSADDAARLERGLPAGGRALTGEPAVRHAIEVAVGRDSVVVGEDQVLHQLRASVDAARARGTLDPALERLFAVALNAGRRARSWRQGPSRSLADVALAAIEQQVGALHGRDVLVVGAGKMGRLAVRSAVTAGASASVANRTLERAETVAAATGGRLEAFDPGPAIGRFAGVVVALDGPWPIGATTMDALAAAETVVVDLSVPAAVPAGIADRLGPRVVTADALVLVDVDGRSADDGSVARLDALVDRSTADFLSWLRGRAGRATAEALARRVDRERDAELAALWKRLPDLDPETRSAIEGMTRHLADRLLREPLERLGRDVDGLDGRTIRDIFAL